jgi:predicted nucleic acid-binding protein
MIAAQALVHRVALVTKYPADFCDIPELEVVAW